MAPGLKLFKREAPEEEVDEEGDGEPEATTLPTHIFGKHLHKVRITTPTTTIQGKIKLKHFLAF